ncbi:MAG TPA: metallophosphoesterase, partial [Anaerolineales bacterium]|nr:metallophosphoesterase [Anaerolineales bacterium]
PPAPTVTPYPTLTATALPSDTPQATQPDSTPAESQEPTQPPATSTSTPVPPLRFAVIGDYGIGSQGEADVAGLVKSLEPEFIITTGDNNYPSGSAKTIDGNIGQYYHDFIFPYIGEYGEGADINRFFPSLGNHDWNTPEAQPYLDYFTLPGNERYYDFTWGPVHLFAIDSDSREPDGVGRSSVQAGWLQERLAASTSPWQIVYMHHPAYSSGPHGSIDWMQWPFKEWGADAVLAGHDHVYERILLDGQLYLTSGLGGARIYSFPSPVPGSQVRYNDDYGALLLEATPERLLFQFINLAGEVVDSYSLAAP